MASNLFGEPVTTETLKEMPEYAGKEITSIDRARVAMQWKHAERKYVKAREFAENLLKKAATDVATIALIYNATGDTVTMESVLDKKGHLFESQFPAEIHNGQWASFLHVKSGGDTRHDAHHRHGFVQYLDHSEVCINYIGTNSDGEKFTMWFYWFNSSVAPKQLSVGADESGPEDDCRKNSDPNDPKIYTCDANGYYYASASIGKNAVCTMEGLMTITSLTKE